MSRATPTEASPELTALVVAAKRTLDDDLRRVRLAVMGGTPGATLPPLVFTGIARARRDALAALGRIIALETQDPAKALATTWLSYCAAGLTSTYEALRTAQVSTSRASAARRLAQERMGKAQSAFAELDRALGCPAGCGGAP